VVSGLAKPPLNQDKTIELVAARADSYLARNLRSHMSYQDQPIQNNSLVVVARLSVANVVVVALEAVSVYADVVLVDSDGLRILHRLDVSTDCVAAHTQARAQDRRMCHEVDVVQEHEGGTVPQEAPVMDAGVQ